MRKEKYIVFISVIVIVMFVMLSFNGMGYNLEEKSKNNPISALPLNQNHISVNESALKWNNINIPSNYKVNSKNLIDKYAINGNIMYVYIHESNVSNSVLSKIGSKIIQGNNFITVISATHSNSSFTIMSKYFLNNVNKIKHSSYKTNENQILIDSHNTKNYVNIDPHSYHKSYSWGQAWIAISSSTYYGKIGAGSFNYLISMISVAAATLTSVVGAWAGTVLAPIVGLLGAVVVLSWSEWVNLHTSSIGTLTPYVTLGISEGNWWDPWNTGAYGELGAYSNQAYNFNGKLTYSGPWLYFPFLTSEEENAGPNTIAMVPHSSVWPSLNPPW